MRIAIIGRTEILFDTAVLLREKGYEIAVIITAKEAPEYTKSSNDFKILAKQWGIPFLHTPKIKEAIGLIKELSAIDIGVSLNYSGIIPNEVIDLFPLGILNAHGGDLPKYRGNACQAWAILNGEKEIGLCVHRMIGGELDSGDIISREYFPVSIGTKITAVYQWMANAIPLLFLEALQKLKHDSNYVLEIQSKDSNDALRCYPRRPEDGRINWNDSAINILRLINACNKPYSGAFCEFKGQKLIIWDAELTEDENYLAIPGQVTLIGDGFIEVATGDGKLRIICIEFEDQTFLPDMLIHSIRERLI